MSNNNLFTNLPNTLPEEVFEDVFKSEKLRIERILSKGHYSPDNDWYDQGENEWVLLVQGEAVLEYEDKRCVSLNAGDYINIPAHVKHRVKWTSPEEVSIWLAIFY